MLHKGNSAPTCRVLSRTVGNRTDTVIVGGGHGAFSALFDTRMRQVVSIGCVSAARCQTPDYSTVCTPVSQHSPTQSLFWSGAWPASHSGTHVCEL